MPRARKNIISLEDTPYYHTTSRCVRRSFLCGDDPYSGENYDHRKQWVLDRLDLASSTFTISICSFAILSNHYHLVLKIDRKCAQQLTNRQVAKRWKQIYAWPQIVSDWYDGESQSQAVLDQTLQIIGTWRERLYELGWFMRSINESIARSANAEDKCTGHFWDGRYDSRVLLDDQALLTCMAYVDLNPIRAGIAQSLENSQFTSIYTCEKNEIPPFVFWHFA